MAAQRALVHPVSLAAIALLIVNDFVLKAAWPGVVTGKLSDFAGLVFFPLLLAIPLGRVVRSRTATIAIAIGITGTWFAAMKVSSFAAAATESLVEIVLSASTIIVDPTDLLALVSLVVAYVLYQRAATDTRGAHRLRTASAVRPSRRFVVISVIAVAALASIATSIPPESRGYTDLFAEDGRVFAGEDDGGQLDLEYNYVSLDGGLSWQNISGQGIPAPQPVTRIRDVGPACLSGQSNTCFRIDGSSVVEESSNGGETWVVSWSLPGGRERFLSRYGSPSDPYDVKSWDLVVVGTPGNTLLVAMGDDGVLRRTVDGTWTRDVLRTAEPLVEAGANIYPEVVAILTLATFALAGAALRSRRLVDLQRPIGRLVSTGLAILPATLILAAYAWEASEGSGTFGLVFVIVGPVSAWVGLAAVAALWSRIIEQDRQTGRRLLLRSTGAILGAAVVASVAFYAWSAGWIQSWLVATALAVSASAAILWIGWHVMSSAEADDITRDVKSPEKEPAVPTEKRPSRWRSRPSLRRWTGASLLWVVGPFLFGVATVIGLVPAYLAARWTQHRSPLARAMAAIGIGFIVSVLFGAVGPGWSNQILASSAAWIVSLMVLRAPNRAAVWARAALVAGIVILAPVFGPATRFVAFAVPLLIAGVDSLTIRAGYGQIENDEEPIPRVPDRPYGDTSPQNDENDREWI